MHLRGFVNGELHEIEDWAKDINAQFVEYEHRNINFFEGNMVKRRIRLGVRYTFPVDIIFPKDALDYVLNLTKPQIERYKFLNWFRKLMGLKKVPKGERIPCAYDGTHNIQFHAVGLKEDNFQNGVEML